MQSRRLFGAKRMPKILADACSGTRLTGSLSKAECAWWFATVPRMHCFSFGVFRSCCNPSVHVSVIMYRCVPCYVRMVEDAMSVQSTKLWADLRGCQIADGHGCLANLPFLGHEGKVFNKKTPCDWVYCSQDNH